MRILEQHPQSAACEKVRWVLDHKRLGFVAQNGKLKSHVMFPVLPSSDRFEPKLVDGAIEIKGGTGICLYLDGMYPDYALISDDPKERVAIMTLNKQAEVLSAYVQDWLFYHLIENQKLASVVLDEVQINDSARFVLAKALDIGLKLKNTVIQVDIDNIEHQILAVVDHISQEISKNQSQFAVGEQFSLADIALCSALAPIVAPIESPWEILMGQTLDEGMLNLRRKITTEYMGIYVNKMYQNYRDARVDWHGQWK